MEPIEAGTGAAPTLVWSVTPWRRDPRKALFVAALTVVTAIGAWWFSGGQVFFGLLALVMLWGSVGSYFITSRFRVDAGGVQVDSPFLKRRRAWSEIRSWYLDDHGATLSPFAGSSWLESYRAVRLLFGADGEAVRRVLRERLGPPGVVNHPTVNAGGGDDV